MDIATGVMKVSETDKSVTYRVACDCGDTDHDAHVYVEWDDELKMAFLTFYKKMEVKDIYWGDGWLKNAWRRVKLAVQILFTGWIEMETDMVFRSHEQLNALYWAINLGLGKFVDDKQETKTN